MMKKITPASPGSNGKPLGLQPARTGVASLTKAEQNIILNGKLIRIDGEPIKLMAEGNEMELCYFFRLQSLAQGNNQIASQLLRENIVGKRILVIPAYATNSFVFKQLGAAEVVGVELDPITATWVKALRDHFHFERVGDFFVANADLTTFLNSPPLLAMKKGKSSLEVVVEKLQSAVRSAAAPTPLEGVEFLQACLGPVPQGLSGIERLGSVLKEKKGFDFIYVPFLFGQCHGIQAGQAIKEALDELWQAANPGARVMITPFHRDWFEAYCQGKFILEEFFNVAGDDRTAILRAIR